MNRNALLVALILLLLGAAGFLVYNSTKKPNVEQAKQQLVDVPKQAGGQEGAPASSGGGSDKQSESDVSGAKEPVTKFVLAAANPSKQLTSDADKKAALEYLSANLKGKVASEYGNDPVKLLGVPRPQKFTVADPRSASKGATVEVTFVLPSGEQKRLFSVERENGKWLITNVKAPTSR